MVALSMAAPLEAQIPRTDTRDVRVEVFRGPSTGWLGMQITRNQRPGGEGTWHIHRVVPDSPAAEAGVRDGDRLVSVDGDPASEEVLDALTTGLRPGEAVRIRVDRGGDQIEFEITAESRPTMILQQPEGGVLTLRSDSALVRMLGGLDTLRVELPRLTLPEGSDTLGTPGGMLRLTPPERWDTLRRYEGALRFMTPDSAQVRHWRFQMPDSTFMQRWYHEFSPDSAQWEVQRWGAAPEGFRLRAPRIEFEGGPMVYWSGRNVLAGAELTPVNEGLAPYFGTERGLLVVDVVEGSPSDHAGLRAGDVVLRIGGTEVATAVEARTALESGWRSPPVAMEILRDRRRLTLEITR